MKLIKTNDTDKLNEISLQFTGIIVKNLTKVLEVENLSLNDLRNLFKELTDKEKDKVLEITINYQLQNLKDIITVEKYRELSRQVDDITDYYVWGKGEELDGIITEGDDIATDLLYKVLGHNGRTLELPIDISYIKKYCLTSNIKPNEIYDALIWIIIRYIGLERCYTWNNEHNKEIEDNITELEYIDKFLIFKKKSKQYFAKQENLCTFAAHDWMIPISCLKIHIIYINSKEQ